jgi:prepilin-type processing-associated H-X9-DG protein
MPKTDDFGANMAWLGWHVSHCKLAEQKKTMEDFCMMTVTRERFPGVSQESIDQAIRQLLKLIYPERNES